MYLLKGSSLWFVKPTLCDLASCVGVRQTALCPGRKGQGPTSLLLFPVPQDVQPPPAEAGGWAKHQQSPAGGGWNCAGWKSGICSHVPSGRAAPPKREQGCHLLLVLVPVTFSVCCRVLYNTQQLEVFPTVMTAALGRHCLFVEKIRRHLAK